jgi:glutamate-1-semialdehyde 2,1-aminomutase
VAAGLATLDAIEAPGFYDRLAATTKALRRRARGRGEARRRGVLRAIGGRHVRLYFADAIPGTYETVMACDKARFNKFFQAMLDAGIYLAPSAFEAGFVSAAHSADDIATTIALAERAFATTR